MKQYRVLTINPGSTSTKIALFEGETCLFSKNVAHDAQELAKFKTIPDQLPYREKTILDLLAQENVDLSTVDVFVGRGGGLLAMEGGTYAVTELLLEHARTCANGVIHPAALGSQLAHAFHNIDTCRAVFKLGKDRRAYDRHFDFTAGGGKTLLQRIGHGDLRMIRADTDALRAVDTADIVDRRFSAAHTDRLGRTALTAGRASDTKIPYQ